MGIVLYYGPISRATRVHGHWRTNDGSLAVPLGDCAIVTVRMTAWLARCLARPELVRVLAGSSG
jgi:hypothetical protein